MSALTGGAGSPEGGIWHSLNRLLLTLIFVMVASVVGYRALPEVSKQHEQEVRIEALKAQIERQNLILARHLREEGLLKNDPEYIGMIARDRLDLMKEGETIYRMESRIDQSKMRRND